MESNLATPKVFRFRSNLQSYGGSTVRNAESWWMPLATGVGMAYDLPAMNGIGSSLYWLGAGFDGSTHIWLRSPVV